MKRVWQCDFCSHTQEKVFGMKEHEETCSFNPKRRSCHTCKHAWDSGYDYSIPECGLKLSTYEGYEEGNCKGWESLENIKFIRKRKLNKIFKK